MAPEAPRYGADSARAVSASAAGVSRACRSIGSKAMHRDVIEITPEITALGRRGLWQEAAALFDALDQHGNIPDSWAFNALISAYARSSRWELAFETFDKMHQLGLPANTETYNSLIKACAKGCHWEGAVALVEEMWRQVQIPDAITFTVLAHALARGSQWQLAEQLLQETRALGIELGTPMACNAVVTACGFKGVWSRALLVLGEARNRGLELTVVTFNAAVAAVGGEKHKGHDGSSWRRALLLLGRAARENLELEVVGYNAAAVACQAASANSPNACVDAAGSGGSSRSASSASSAGRSAGGAGSTSTSSAQTRFGAAKAARQLLVDIHDRAMVPNLATYNAVLAANSGARQWAHACALLRDARRRGLESIAEVCCTSTAAACTRASEWQSAIVLLRGAARERPRLPARRARACDRDATAEYNAALTAAFASSSSSSARSGDAADVWRKGLEELVVLVHQGPEPSIVTYNLLANACTRCRQWQASLRLFEDAGTAALRRDVVAFGGALNACDKGARWASALSLMSKLKRHRLQPSPEAVGASVSACRAVVSEGSDPSGCAVGSSWELALRALAAPREDGVQPSAAARGAAASACDRASQWGAALLLLHEVSRVAVEPTLATRGAALFACDRARRWREALLLLDLAKIEGVAKDIGSCSATISACARADQWQRAVKLHAAIFASPGLRPDNFTRSAVAAAWISGNRWELALENLLPPGSPVTQADAVLCRNALAVCAESQEWSLALELALRAMPSLSQPMVRPLDGAATPANHVGRPQADVCQEEVDTAACNAALDACKRGRQHRLARELLSGMHRARAEPDVISYSIVVDACGQSRQWKDALQLAEDAHQAGCPPDAAARTAVMVACGNGGLWRRALLLLVGKRAAGPPVKSPAFFGAPRPAVRASVSTADGRPAPTARGSADWDVLSYNAAVAMLGRCGQAGKALGIVDEMWRRRLAADPIAVDAALDALERRTIHRSQGSAPSDEELESRFVVEVLQEQAAATLHQKCASAVRTRRLHAKGGG